MNDEVLKQINTYFVRIVGAAVYANDNALQKKWYVHMEFCHAPS